MKQIYIPQIDEYPTSVNPCERLLKSLASVFETEEEIRFNFQNCGFITAEGIAILAGAKYFRDQNNVLTSIDEGSINPSVNIVLKRWGFLNLFSSQSLQLIQLLIACDTSIPIYRQHKLKEDEIVFYIDNAILNRSEMPQMSKELRKEMRRAFFEVFGNIFYHSNSQVGGLVCGQVFPQEKLIQIVFYDAGVGIARHVRESNIDIQSDQDAISWALERGNSTLSTRDVPRGLGLYLIRKFIEVNKGVFRVYANNAMIIEDCGLRQGINLSQGVKGTLIDMRIRIKEDIRYTLFSKDEI